MSVRGVLVSSGEGVCYPENGIDYGVCASDCDPLFWVMRRVVYQTELNQAIFFDVNVRLFAYCTYHEICVFIE